MAMAARKHRLSWRGKAMRVGVFALLMAAVLAAPALAQEAEDISEQCKYTAPSKHKISRLYDGQYTTYWLSREMLAPHVEIKTPEGKAAHALYICFGEMPDAWEIQTQDDTGAWKTHIQGDTRFMHVFVPLDGLEHFRLMDATGKKTQMKINQLRIFAQGDIPSWVQRWEETPEKADMLLLVAHPDDEILFFGGTIPTYASQREMNVIVAYMTYSNTTRRSELLNGLWHMGMRTYPIIGDFHDSYSHSLEDGYKRWKKKEAQSFVIELIRRYRPEVLLSHDIEGEYGHGAHRVCADVAQFAVQNSMDAQVYEESAQAYGTWGVKKLYLHLYAQNAVEMNWRMPLDTLGGKTGVELAQEAYEMHVTQQTTKFFVEDSGETNCAAFGLFYSTVGEDRQGNDFFENIVVAQ